MSRNNMRISTATLAKICGVSQGTVDRALNNRSDIKAETRQKILEIARLYGYREKINYVPDVIKGQIGVVVFNLEDFYFTELITELEYILSEEGFGLTVMFSHYDKEYEIACIRNLYNMGVNGIVLCSVNGGPTFDNYLRMFDIPIVSLGSNLTSVPYVGVDDFAAMVDMTQAVLQDKPEQIVYYSPALLYDDSHAQRRRYEGFLSAVGNTPYSVVTNITDIQQEYDKPTTIMCVDDYHAMKVFFKGTNARITGFDGVKMLDKLQLNIRSVGCSIQNVAREISDILTAKKKGSVIVPHEIMNG